jgi:hypothetical protein
MKRATNALRSLARDFSVFWCIRIPAAITRAAASLPTSREVQDGALYAAAFVGVIVVLTTGVPS